MNELFEAGDDSGDVDETEVVLYVLVMTQAASLLNCLSAENRFSIRGCSLMKTRL